MKRVGGILLALALAAQPGRAQTRSVTKVLSSPHAFAPGSPGSVTSSETRACVFCHISHTGEKEKLWNQRSSMAGYVPYASPSMDAAAADVAAGASKLCLSCHDGTVAVGETVALGQVATSGPMSPSAVTGPNFSGHHPVGIRPVDDGQLYPGLGQTPATSADPAVTLPGGIIECTTCHDPHVDDIDATRRRFLVTPNDNGALCLACHDPTRPAPSSLDGWTSGAHATASHSRSEFYNSVRANACSSCHVPHQAAGSLPLLRAAEEGTCFACHAGTGTSPALLSVMSELSKPYGHPVSRDSGLHSSVESAYPLNANRHAECPDCHNAHAARAWTSTVTAPAVSPPLSGTSGVDASGQGARRPAANEYEICLKCHGSSSGKPQGPGYSAYGYTASRQTDVVTGTSFDTRLEFSSTVARHNVMLPRRLSGSAVPSLRTSMLTLGGAATGRSLAVGTYIYCGDCHNSDEARSAGGSQAAGAHGSMWPHILERRYATEPPPATPGGSSAGVAYQSGVSGTAALCVKCHDVDGSILEDRSFGEHNKHVAGERTPCATCHDSHGINGGTAANNRSLVNFDTAIVGPSSSGILRFESTGTFSGRCYLRCHGMNHNPESY